jgi:hypothetical protein
VGRRNRRPVVVRHTVQAVGLHIVPGAGELRTGQEAVHHTALVGVVRHIGLAGVVRRIDLVGVVRHIDLEEARHIDLAEEVHHTGLEAALHIGFVEAVRHTVLVEEHRTVLGAEEHHTGREEVRRIVRKAAGHSLAEEGTVGSALVAVVDSSLAEEVVRILGVGELNAFSMRSP